MDYDYLDEAGLSRTVEHLKVKGNTATLLSNAWSEVVEGSTATGVYTQSVNVLGVTTSNVVIVSNDGMTNAQKSECASVKLKPTAQGAGTLTFTAVGEPTINLPVSVVVQGGIAV